MKRFAIAIAAVLTLAVGASAVKTVNGRAVPDSTDRTTYGNSTYFRLVDTLLAETANLMGATKNGDDLAVDDINCDTIAATGNAHVTGAMFSGDAWVTDTLRAKKVIFGAGNTIAVDSLVNKVIAGQDTLVIVVNGKKLHIAVDNEP